VSELVSERVYNFYMYIVYLLHLQLPCDTCCGDSSLMTFSDREIEFFELSSFEPYCQISLLETVPLHMDFCATGPDECLIVYGDTNGCINILVIRAAGECLRLVSHVTLT